MGNKEIVVVDKLSSVMTVDELAKIAAEEGVTVRAVLKLLAKGMRSQTVPRLNNTGHVIEATVVDDMPTQHKFMQSAAEILRLVRKDLPEVVGTVEHKVDKETLDRIEGFIKEVARLEQIGYSDPIQRGAAIDADYKSL